MSTPLLSARRNHDLSALITRRAVKEARRARTAGRSVLGVVVAHQVTNARTSDRAVGEMLAEQNIDVPPDALLDSLSFTTDAQTFDAMTADLATDYEFDRLVASLVQDAAAAAMSASVTTRARIGWVRHLNTPSCSRCAVLAGRVYRYSDGFMRHPGDDCTTTPVREGDQTFVEDPAELMRRGLITGLSKDDQQAINDGANFGQVVNVRRKASGLVEAGHTLTRGGRPTPAGIYRLASDREDALRLLAKFGYIT